LAEQIVPSWMSAATSGPVVRRAFLYFVIVGTVLIGINHGDALLRGDVDGIRLFKMLLTRLVPYTVSTLSSVSAIRAHAAEQPPPCDPPAGRVH
jgi:hypothetical protein